MGWYVHIHVCFAADGNDGIAELAGQYFKDWPEIGCKEAKWFLEDLSQRSGKNPGPKGGLLTWGMIGNHTNVGSFVGELKLFWIDLLSEKIKGGPHDFERIMVFYEHEQSEAANAFEIYLDEDTKSLIIKHHARLPFSWRQY